MPLSAAVAELNFDSALFPASLDTDLAARTGPGLYYFAYSIPIM